MSGTSDPTGDTETGHEDLLSCPLSSPPQAEHPESCPFPRAHLSIGAPYPSGQPSPAQPHFSGSLSNCGSQGHPAKFILLSLGPAPGFPRPFGILQVYSENQQCLSVLARPECVFGSECNSKSQAGSARTKIRPRPPPPAHSHSHLHTYTFTLTHSRHSQHCPPPTAPPGHTHSSILSATSALSAVPGPLPASLRFILKEVQHLTHFPRAGLGGNNCCYIGRALAALGRCPGFYRAGAPLTPCMGAPVPPPPRTHC